MEPLVSVVTPFYNTRTYLAECIESVRRQRFSRWEYVLVDNASTDGSGEIAQRFAGVDSRVRVVQCDDHLPQVPNYNRALGLISSASKYVKVVEADNWLFPGCLEEMVALAEFNPRIGIVSAYNTTETQLRLTGLPLARTVIDGREAARIHLQGDLYLFGAPTTVMMRADIVRSRNPFFDESAVFAEDQSACLEALRENDFGFVHQILTFVRTENESTLTAFKDMDAMPLVRSLLLRRHGCDFYTPNEVCAVERRIMRNYYADLAKAALRRRPPGYWDFHRGGLQSSGMGLDRMRLARAILRECLARAANPAPHLRNWVKRWRSADNNPLILDQDDH